MRARAGLAAISLLLLLGEVTARLSGITDVPLYLNSPSLGYIPAPGQQGAFLRRNDWAFNEHSMGVAEPFAPSARRDIVLLGDSIVYGGNPYRQHEKVGPLLERLTGDEVWPVSAGSWGLANELAYLKENPRVLSAADVLVFVLNNADFYGASVWASELTHPTHRPTSALIYTLERYVAPRFGLNLATEKPQRLLDWRDDWSTLTKGKRTVVLLYPDKAGEPFNWPELPGAEVVDVANIPEWKKSYYHDDIHPTPEGARVLAAIIAKHLR